jgi:hypothetical protein
MTRLFDMMDRARVNNAHTYCAISHACAPPGLVSDMEAGHPKHRIQDRMKFQPRSSAARHETCIRPTCKRRQAGGDVRWPFVQEE